MLKKLFLHPIKKLNKILSFTYLNHIVLVGKYFDVSESFEQI